LGAGSAVASVDLSATFDAPNATAVVHLENFTEGALKISTSADSWAAGFDQLLVRCTSPNSGDPTLQTMALDTLQVMLTLLSGSTAPRLKPQQA
jgi:hypothetical protein